MYIYIYISLSLSIYLSLPLYIYISLYIYVYIDIHMRPRRRAAGDPAIAGRSRFGSFQFGSIPRPVPKLKRFGSVRPVRFSFLFLPAVEDAPERPRIRPAGPPHRPSRGFRSERTDGAALSTPSFPFRTWFVQVRTILIIHTSMEPHCLSFWSRHV